jgi:hypothetical protein
MTTFSLFFCARKKCNRILRIEPKPSNGFVSHVNFVMAYLFATPQFQALLCALHLAPPHAMILLRDFASTSTTTGTGTSTGTA